MSDKIPFSRFILHSFFPERCPSCGRVVNFGELFCGICESDIHKPGGNLCMRCFCSKQKCICHTNPHYDRVFAPFVYSGTIRNSLLTLKDERNELLIDYFAREIAREILLRCSDITIDAVIPVPMHSEKLAKRGYNQSALIAQNVAMRLDLKYDENILLQQTLNKTQHDLNYEGRRENVKGIYKALSSHGYKTVLLVDDIITTGFTLSECAGELKKSGVETVICVGVAKNQFEE